jgi:glutamate racemase
MANKSAAIGVFDSGVGGLSVVQQIQAQLPHENILYLGDTARVPYGSKSTDSVLKYTRQCADKLVAADVKALVIACNTAASVGTEVLRASYPNIPIIGVIEPGASAAVSHTKNGHVAVIATESTVAAGSYVRAIHALNPDIEVRTSACSLFVSLAEEGWVDGSLVEAILARYLNPLFQDPEHHPDTLVLGCTHYPVLKAAIANVVGPRIQLVDSANTTAGQLKVALTELGLLQDEASVGRLQCWVTDGPERFIRVARLFLGHELDPNLVQLVDL